ncbi:probable transcriptional regulatory protein Cthe_2075 [Xenia sp. Carnegie-2017]|uniref:probable transcriptional regulatory protein Cthe_2075 n=1 Tax=Xenia sp. Carnegie-2017 TaxID=2897299 RepID=UPI001F03A838|nr:probable transcriptional regulatory protein Cthe_2075 [Xenia sp. Carnegie-2017]
MTAISRRFQISPSLIIAVRTRTMAGHSKWSNIKFKKMHRDIARAKILGRLHKEIVTAVRENGPCPNLNSKLEHIIERAKAANMTKDKIESAIKSGVKNTDKSCHSLLIEGHGPGGCGILVDTLTSNNSLTRNEIRTLFMKNGGHVGDDGSVSFMYEHKGIVCIENRWSSSDNVDDLHETSSKAEELAIDVGAEDFHFATNADDLKLIQFVCASSDLIQVSNRLTKEKNYTLVSANLEYLPRTLIKLNDQNLVKVSKLLEKIHEHEDVIKIYDNIQDYESETLKEL